MSPEYSDSEVDDLLRTAFTAADEQRMLDLAQQALAASTNTANGARGDGGERDHHRLATALHEDDRRRPQGRGQSHDLDPTALQDDSLLLVGPPNRGRRRWQTGPAMWVAAAAVVLLLVLVLAKTTDDDHSGPAATVSTRMASTTSTTQAPAPVGASDVQPYSRADVTDTTASFGTLFGAVSQSLAGKLDAPPIGLPIGLDAIKIDHTPAVMTYSALNQVPSSSCQRVTYHGVVVRGGAGASWIWPTPQIIVIASAIDALDPANARRLFMVDALNLGINERESCPGFPRGGTAVDDDDLNITQQTIPLTVPSGVTYVSGIGGRIVYGPVTVVRAFQAVLRRGQREVTITVGALTDSKDVALSTAIDLLQTVAAQYFPG